MLSRTFCAVNVVGNATVKLQSRMLSAAADEVKTFALEYTYVPNMIERRVPVRAAHFKFTEPYLANKTLVAGGAYMPSLEGGLLIFRAKRSVVEQFAKGDPYTVEGLVTEYKIREWNVVVGSI